MYVRPVKRICDVRGCKNKDCFSISRVKEAGNTPIICKSCLGKALSALDEPEVVKAKEKKPIPTLFYNSDAFPSAPDETPKTSDGEHEAEGGVQTNESDADDTAEQKDEEVVPDENEENLVTPSAPDETPKAKKRATKKGDK